MPNYYYSGQGSLYVAKRNAATGKAEGFIAVGNVPELSIDISVDKFEHKESETGGRLLDLTIIKQKTGTFKYKLENLNLENLALGLFGESSTVIGGTVASGTPENIDIPMGAKSMRFPLANAKVAAVVVKGSDNIATMLEGTDYTVDLTNGVIILPAAGAIVTAAALAATSIKVSYTYAGYTNLESFTSAAAPERWLRFEGLNTVDNSSVIIDMYRAQFDPLTGYSLLSDEVASVDMGGTLLADSFITSGSKFFRQRNI